MLTYQAELPFHLLCTGPRVAVMINQLKCSTDLGFADALGGVGDALALHARFLVLEVEAHTEAGGEENGHGDEREGSNLVF